MICLISLSLPLPILFILLHTILFILLHAVIFPTIIFFLIFFPQVETEQYATERVDTVRKMEVHFMGKLKLQTVISMYRYSFKSFFIQIHKIRTYL